MYSRMASACKSQILPYTLSTLIPAHCGFSSTARISACNPKSLKIRRCSHPWTDLYLMRPTRNTGDCHQPSSGSGMSRGTRGPLRALWNGHRIATGFISSSCVVILGILCTLPLSLWNVSYRPITSSVCAENGFFRQDRIVNNLNSARVFLDATVRSICRWSYGRGGWFVEVYIC